jgi:hypothetical protein
MSGTSRARTWHRARNAARCAPEAPTPKWRQVVDPVKAQQTSGVLGPTGRLPSLRLECSRHRSHKVDQRRSDRVGEQHPMRSG